jgi:large subunit ribosomal protein L30
MYAAIRIRGSVNMAKELKDTLNMLMITRVNHCVLVDKKSEGMLKKAMDYVTWGEISDEVMEKLIVKRGGVEKKEAKKVIEKIKKEGVRKAGLKPVFRLSPPRKGYRSTRSAFPKGDLGYRGEEINSLLKRMI